MFFIGGEMKRGFAKIKWEVFKQEVINDKDLYNDYQLPVLKTQSSAAYDILLLSDINIKRGEIIKIPTGIKAYMQNDEVLLLFVRSSTGFKYNIRLCNQVGVIDADYYGNEKNDGHIWVALQNEGDQDVKFQRNEAIVQVIFMPILRADNIVSTNKRKGGLGSTGKGE